MARLPRFDFAGYYHVLNRGVDKRTIFVEHEDYVYFLALIDELGTLYRFNLHAYCLMGNHYHLLIETTDVNLSLVLKQLNHRYTLYFNKKYHRVGTLWQGRFKSWCVHNEDYLDVLTKYIEHNPIKAGIATSVGQYPWASCISKERPFSPNDNDKLFEHQKIKTFKHATSATKTIPLSKYFENSSRNMAIIQAIHEGYRQCEIALFLKLSDVAISKIIKNEKNKEKLFEKLKHKGIFWSYNALVTRKAIGDDILIEYLLKYGDFDDIVMGFSLYGKRETYRVWHRELKNDLRFKKLNLFLARIFFAMDIEADYFRGGISEREKKLRLLAS